ncbi:MAG: Gldg family protein [Verrucomicrobiota bacterium]
MSEQDPPSAPPTARSLNRWGIGTLSLLQTALLAIIVIGANYLALHHFQRWDLSRSEDYSLSPATKRYLQSGDLKERMQPVRWVFCFRRTSPFYERMRALAEEYERLSNGKIELEIVDPIRSADRMEEVSATYGLTLVRDLLVIDARTDDSPPVREAANGTKALNPHVKLVLDDEIGVHSTADGNRRITAFQGEDVMTARLVEALEGRPRKMALIADKSGPGAVVDHPERRALENLLRFQNIELMELRFAGLQEIPSEVEGMVFLAPRYDLEESEAAMIERYWQRPRSALLVLTGAGETPPRLRAFLRSNGVTPRRDRIVTMQKNQLVTSARGMFTAGINFLSDLARQTTEFGGPSTSLEVREGAEDLVSRKIQPMSLVRVDPAFWGETRFGHDRETFSSEEDTPSPLDLAASVTRGAQADDRYAADTSRMIVVANTGFLDPANHRPENLDFLASSVNWLVGRESLAGIGPRSLGTYKLPLYQAQITFINRANLFFLPAALLIIGGIVWSVRRA